jgi:ribosomal protein S18 acetylase RimI-like enzyme
MSNVRYYFIDMKIIKATEKDIPKVRELFYEYQQWLRIDLCFQNFEEELATLPGSYSPPAGVIFLAVENSDVVGCVGVRPRVESEAELKRLYVRPDHHGRGIGKQLFLTAMSEAKSIGYTSIVLDTLPAMQVARSLYLNYGFEKIPANYENPLNGVDYYRYVFG